jgi:very-short-patch-repair endonuclease
VDWRDLARYHAGAISRAQLRSCGLTENEVRGLVRRRDLSCLLPGVYAPRPVPDSFLQRAWAAVLWSGGVLSHRSAAVPWELAVPRTPAIEISVAHSWRRRVPHGVRLHRLVRGVDGVTESAGLPLTDRVTTIVELLRSERIGIATSLLDRSLQRGWLGPADLTQAIVAGRCRPGNRQLRELIDSVEPGADAESERILHRLLRRAGLTSWVPQYRVQLPGRVAYIDVAFPEQRLAIEVDGRRYHDEFSDHFESDRTRQNELQAQGWRVLRFTWRSLNDDPRGALAKIIQLLTP